jgi:hypothetical protein
MSPNKKPAALLAPYFMMVSCLAYFSTLKMEAIYYSETSVYFSTDYMALYSRR